MTDSADERLRQLRANFMALQAQHTDVSRRMVDAAYEVGKSEGFTNGWNAGYDYAQQRFQELMRLQPQPPAPAQPPPTNSTIMNERPPTAAEIVLEIIRHEPGLRGVEIVEKTGAMSEPLLERTVRTALYRLKNASKIRSDNERWYVVAEEDGQFVEEQMT